MVDWSETGSTIAAAIEVAVGPHKLISRARHLVVSRDPPIRRRCHCKARATIPPSFYVEPCARPGTPAVGDSAIGVAPFRISYT